VSLTYVRRESPAAATSPGRRAPQRPLSTLRWVFTGAWLTVGLLTIWAACYLVFVSGIQHARTQHQLYATFRAQAAQTFVPFGGLIAPGTPVAMVSAASAGLKDEIVVEGTSSQQLREGPGHLRTTPMPGQPGVSVLYGRSVSFGGPFGDLSSMHIGDSISVTTGQGVFAYSVSGVRHAGDLIPPLAAGGSRLTLVSSQSSGWRSGWAPESVVYVDATLNGQSQPDPGGRPRAVPPAEKLMARQSDPLTLMTILLWLQLLVVTAGLAAWAQARWGRLQVWLVGGPALLAGLWGLSDGAAALLPNVF